MLAGVPFDWQVTDSFFVVAHFHYVMLGSLLFPIFGGLYYWMPKLSGRFLSERLGKWNFWLMLLGFNLAFFPMHVSGLLGMPRRVYTYPSGLGLETPNLLSTVGAFVLGLSVLTFMANVVFSVYLGRGRPAVDNAWDAGSLDWATPSPPPDEGYRVPPIVHSRLPLWHQERLDEGEPAWVKLVHALEHYPTKWRASLVTSLTEGEPEAIVRLPGPSILPLVAAFTLMVVFAAELYNVHPLAVGAGLIMTLSIVAWMWPPALDRQRRLAEDGGPTIHGLPVYVSGPRAPGWWGMLLTLLVMAVGSACLIFSYFYLQVRSPQWPPPEIPKPGLLLPMVNLGVLFTVCAALFWALRSVRANQQTGLIVGSTGSLALGMLFMIVQGVEFTRWEFTPDLDAYTSIFGTLAGLQTAFVLLGVILSAVVSLQAALGYFNHWRFLAVENVANYWYFVTGHWLVLLVVLYVTPVWSG
jgi:cytochrome c oxidase subunit I+III